MNALRESQHPDYESLAPIGPYVIAFPTPLASFYSFQHVFYLGVSLSNIAPGVEASCLWSSSPEHIPRPT